MHSDGRGSGVSGRSPSSSMRVTGARDARRHVRGLVDMHPTIGDLKADTAAAKQTYDDVKKTIDDAKKTVDDVKDAAEWAKETAEEAPSKLAIIAAAAAAGTTVVPPFGTVIATVGAAIYCYADDIVAAFDSLGEIGESKESKCQRLYGTNWDEHSQTCGGSTFTVDTSPEARARANAIRRSQMTQSKAYERSEALRLARDCIARGFYWKPYVVKVPPALPYIDPLTGALRLTPNDGILPEDYVRGGASVLEDIIWNYQTTDEFRSSGPQDGSEYPDKNGVWKKRPVVRIPKWSASKTYVPSTSILATPTIGPALLPTAPSGAALTNAKLRAAAKRTDLINHLAPGEKLPLRAERQYLSASDQALLAAADPPSVAAPTPADIVQAKAVKAAAPTDVPSPSPVVPIVVGSSVAAGVAAGLWFLAKRLL